MKRLLLAVGVATSLAALPAAAFAATAPEHPMTGMPCMGHAHARTADCTRGQATAKPAVVRNASSNFTPAELRQIWSSP